MNPRKEIPTIEQIEFYCNEKDFKQAKRLTHRRLAHDLHDASSWEMLGFIDFWQRNYVASIKSFEKSDSLQPLDTPGKIGLARSYAYSDDKEYAKNLLNDISNNIFNDPVTLLKLASAWDSVEMPIQAMKTCREAILQDPQYSQAYYDLAYYAGQCGYKFHLVESLARKAISLSPDDPNYRLGLSVMLVQQNKDSEAYDLVRDFTEQQISSLKCTCCLERLLNLFEHFNDFSKVTACKNHLQELELRLSE